MSNNPILFNAALSGAFSGINTSRSLSSAIAADYTTQKDNAFAFATLLDAQLVAGSYTPGDGALLQSLVQEVVSSKGSAAANLVSITAILAAFEEARASLDPAGESVVMTPLTQIRYVDPFSVATGTPNGSAANPFLTIQEAADDLTAGGCIFLAPGAYPAETLTLDDFAYQLVGIAQGTVDISACTITSNLSLILQDLLCGVISTAASLYAVRANLFSAVEVVEGSGFDSCYIAAPMFLSTGVAETSATFNNSFIQAALNGQNFVFKNTGIQADVTASKLVEMHNCQFTLGTMAVAVTGQLRTDLVSYMSRGDATGFALAVPALFTGVPYGAPQEELNYAAAAPSTVLTLLPDNHPEGLYLLSAPIVIRTASGAGTIAPTFTWNTPTAGAQSKTLTGVAVTALGTFGNGPLTVYSDGTAPITVQYTPAGIGAAPVIDIYASAVQAGIAAG